MALVIVMFLLNRFFNTFITKAKKKTNLVIIDSERVQTAKLDIQSLL